MKLLIFSHKICWESPDSPTGWATDGGFAMHMDAIASKFEEVKIITAVEARRPIGEMFFRAKNTSFEPLKEWVDPSNVMQVKLVAPFWLLRYSFTFIRLILRYDAVHIPLPSHIGLIGFLISLLLGKKIFVRHCGNWLAPATFTERLIKWLMIKTGGGKRVYFATGGASTPPSAENETINWIFSSSMWESELQHKIPAKDLDPHKPIKLIHVARQELEKGAMVVIEALPNLIEKYPQLHLTIVGFGLALPLLKKRVSELSLDSYVYFTGKLNHDGVLSSLSQSDIFCYPTTASEGFPKVVLEAMSLGLPIITNPISILAKLIPDTGSGLLMEESTSACFCSKLELILSDPKLYKTLSINGMKHASNYTLEGWANTIYDALNKSWHIE
jgi:glycosyltransferase involved in cell wall biosynthesis